MKRIAIITCYYNSVNYGGNLQAYALWKVLNNHGYDAEQIDYISNPTELKSRMNKLKKMNLFGKYKKVVFFAKNKITNFVNQNEIAKIIESRKKAFKDFNRNVISHSDEVYSDETIIKCADKYDIFITGSDQVWNPMWFRYAYFLKFVSSDKIKFSYAASISQNQLTSEQLDFFKTNLHDYTAVSVREQNAVELLKDVSPVKVEWVLDPTLLLSQEQWDEICPDRIIDDDYVFCYFLGSDITERKVAEEFAENRKLKIITLPYLLGIYQKCDKHFGDYKLYDISPPQFISLVKHAKYIFTDSFHATVFSGIYKKQYFIFERSEHKSMSSRIYSMCKLFSSESRFCNTPDKINFNYINSLTDIDYTKLSPEFEKMKEKSMEYLLTNLSKNEE
jgi:Polysaccharide pyruvyl transferase.